MARRVVSAILVGRDEELDTIRLARSRAADGDPSLVLISGEAGVGKTRLIQDATAEAERDGWLVLTGGAIAATDGALPFGPFTMALRPTLRGMADEQRQAVVGAGGRYLSRLIPEVGGPDRDPGGDERYLQGRIFAAVTTVLTNLATDRPIAVVIEDVHWADRSSRALLAHLVHTLTDEPVLLIASLREEGIAGNNALASEIAELDRHTRVVRIRLAALDEAGTGELVRSLGYEALEPEAVAGLHRRSGGLPFFLEELLSMSGPVVAGDVPPTVREIVLVRIAALPADAQVVLQATACVGRAIDDDLIREVAGLDDRSGAEAIRECLRQHLLVRDGGDLLAFRHDLVRDAIYADLLAGERRSLHLAVAHALSGRGSAAPTYERATLLALQWDLAAAREQALPAFLAAAQASMQAGAWAEAQRAAERALALWPTVDDERRPDDIAHADLLMLSAAAAARVDDGATAVERARAAVAEIRPSGDLVALGSGLERLGWYAYQAGSTDLSIDAGRESVEAIPRGVPLAVRARALSTFANRLSTLDRDAEALPLAGEALHIATAVGDLPEVGRALHAQGLARCSLGAFEAGLKDLRRAQALAISEADDDLAVLANFDLGWALWANGDHRAAVAQIEVTQAVVSDLGLGLVFDTMVKVQELEMRHCAGELRPEHHWSHMVRQLLPDAAFPLSSPMFMVIRLAVAGGDLEDGLRTADVELDTDEPQVLSQWHASRVYAYAYAGEADRAWEATEAALALAPAHRVVAELVIDAARSVATMATVARARGALRSLQLAAERFDQLADALRRFAAFPDGKPKSSVASAAAALLAAERGSLTGQADADRWTEAADLFHPMPWPEREAYARIQAAEAAAGGRDHGRASESLRMAAKIVERIGAPLLAADIHRLAARARIQIDTAEAPSGFERVSLPADPVGLTEREREVLRLLVDGRTNREIGSALFISPKTAGVHVSNILGKLGAKNRVEAANAAHRLGLAAPSR